MAVLCLSQFCMELYRLRKTRCFTVGKFFGRIGSFKFPAYFPTEVKAVGGNVNCKKIEDLCALPNRN